MDSLVLGAEGAAPGLVCVGPTPRTQDGGRGIVCGQKQLQRAREELDETPLSLEPTSLPPALVFAVSNPLMAGQIAQKFLGCFQALCVLGPQSHALLSSQLLRRRSSHGLPKAA